MRKWLWLGFIAGVCLTVSSVVGAYFYARSQLPQLPGLLQRSLREQGIQLTFEKTLPLPDGISIRFHEVSIAGKQLPVKVTAETITLSLLVKPAWPPIH